MRRLICLLCLMLASCAPRGDGRIDVYRAVSVPIFSNAAFNMDRLVGTWIQADSFSSGATRPCRSGKAVFAPGPKGLTLTYRLCLSGQEVTGAGLIAATGPGRFKVLGRGGLDQDWWVIWVDEGYRTLAIGTPSGAFGFILNRGEKLPQDRRKAAGEVFDFNGYDVGKLRPPGA